MAATRLVMNSFHLPRHTHKHQSQRRLGEMAGVGGGARQAGCGEATGAPKGSESHSRSRPRSRSALNCDPTHKTTSFQPQQLPCARRPACFASSLPAMRLLWLPPLLSVFLLCLVLAPCSLHPASSSFRPAKATPLSLSRFVSEVKHLRLLVAKILAVWFAGCLAALPFGPSCPASCPTS